MGWGVVRPVELGLKRCGMRAGKRWSEIDSLPRAMATTLDTEKILDVYGAVRDCVQEGVLDTVEIYVGHAPYGASAYRERNRTFCWQ